ncbi:protein GLE1 isoform X2 [Phalaenopsis equestris]|uniref:protein GLE1 isoform X2 n=1 Tax=Phalaenopsis equestris TaxID=78828 RepID=UPI0009E28695|nr:protein GLE1 isoform X2 [Phalaenopsis equestris]
MGYVKLEIRCPKNVAIVTSADPDPVWTLDDLLSELNSLELQHGARISVSSPPKKSKMKEMANGSNKPFVMRITDDDVYESESEDESTDQRLITGTRFAFPDDYFSESDEFDDEMHEKSTPSRLMQKKSIEEGALFELESDHQLMVKEQLRSKLSSLELSQKIESENSSFAMRRLEKQAEARQELDRRLDKQYQRKIAEILDNHLSILQRNHEQRSQIEERRIRDDATLEEAKRKEKALIDEKLRQEKSKAEAEVRLNAIKQAEAQKAAQEAEIRAAKEAAEKQAARITETAVFDASKKDLTEPKGVENTRTSGIRVIASKAALEAESNRLAIYDEVAGRINVIDQKVIDKHGRQMYKYIKQIGGTVENVRAKAHVLVQLIKDPMLPLSISLLVFANKVVSLCENPSGSFDKSAFACGWVIVLIASQVPDVMDLVLAEFHRSCIYTVPKHLQASDAASQTKDYWKMLGYREEDGKIESTNEFLNRVESCMKLYAALIQTEIVGVKNPYGLNYGWAWLAMFLNALPANRTTAVALEAFLKMAGFSLLRKYKSQFMKVLNVISRRFLPSLKQRGEAVHDIVMKLEQYLDDKIYLREPEGRQLQASSLSKFFE